MTESWPSTQSSLILAIKNPQNADAWHEFVERYRSPIIQFCRSQFGIQEALAEDVAQNVLVKLITSIQKFRIEPTGSFRGWLKTVTKHAVIDVLAIERRRLDVAKGGLNFDGAVCDFPAATQRLADTVADQLRRDLLEQAEQIVRPRIRNSKNWKAYSLRKQGEHARLIARDLGMSVAAVHKARSRIVEMIREEIHKLLSGC